ncbi:MAG TPA: hypothetical protein VHB20_07465 [Verrucomicrobiae bacterium]|jgi:hypothetical protein|nr:hypothetical protein [Verrucomicrobiae bacterium]
MITVICILTLPDGATVTGTLRAESAQGSYPIQYTGAVERLTDRCQTGDATDLKALFTLQALASHGSLSVSETGLYERWAD